MPVKRTDRIKPRGSKAVLMRRLSELRRERHFPESTKTRLEAMTVEELENSVQKWERSALEIKLMHHAELETPSDYLSAFEYDKISNKYKRMNLQQLEKEYEKAKSRKTYPNKSKAVLIRRVQESQRQLDLPVDTKAKLQAWPVWRLQERIRLNEWAERQKLQSRLYWRLIHGNVSDADRRKLMNKYSNMSTAQLKKLKNKYSNMSNAQLKKELKK